MTIISNIIFETCKILFVCEGAGSCLILADSDYVAANIATTN